jgi:hypothetical protein
LEVDNHRIAAASVQVFPAAEASESELQITVRLIA